MSRLRGALTGAGVFSLLPAASAAWGAAVNPWFMDAPLAFLGLALLPFALLGALLRALLGRGSQRLGGGLLALSTATVLLAAVRPTPGPVSPRLLIYGIDGAGWSLLDTLETPALDDLQAQRPQPLGHDGGGAMLLEAELGVGVQVPAQGDEIGEFGGRVGGGGEWLGHARAC